ncbi:right-handed parallel beta-helix repeat-containing protein [Geobacter sp. DSM 9736]|uniref:right-handed parallel beta-helix repeat-containing protein n=1 Tax=Geobacter sp. DSM 9736 TaxID=1277350 RepID=UPI000B5097AE|nr:right-handed parallel beta-helix repeat-containing protein [Geobacter sp. DSM 9736]SNB47459.1 parallel beta-helix repeat (two copies) [Geobacter sp. DSM 9736]
MLKAFIQILLLILIPAASSAEILKADTVWKGQIVLTEDVVVPQGVTLTVEPSTVVIFSAAESTKTDPEYLSPLTELTVRGKLQVLGTEQGPVVFGPEGERKAEVWAGIIIDGGTASFSFCRVTGAETAVAVLRGRAHILGGELKGNRYGTTVHGPDAEIVLRNAQVKDNDYGVFSFDGGRVSTELSTVAGNRKKDLFSGKSKRRATELGYEAPPPRPLPLRYKDAVLLGETVWQGTVEVSGLVRVPENSRLVVLPGTVVEFRRKDTNGDGIGENGLLIQGRLIAKGTRKQPIFFRSSEKERKPADWDALNIMNSDGAQNLIEYCQIENAYRGLHFHFSNVAVTNTVLRNNFRGIQFQESMVELRGNYLYDNRSGIQGRDSEVLLLGNMIGSNLMGVNFYRVNLSAARNRFAGNVREGVRIRESVPRFEENFIEGNRFGLLVADCVYGSFRGNVIVNNGETGFSVKTSDNLDISGNYISQNGLNGLNLQDVRSAIKGNVVADNGERGIGIISFDGVVTGNNLEGNGLYAVDLEGSADVVASGNWWGTSRPEEVVMDRRRDPARGSVIHKDPAPCPPLYVWPVADIPGDVAWRGSLDVLARVTVLPGATLRIFPGTEVRFGKEVGMAVKGRILATGEAGREVRFTSIEGGETAAWDEILLEHADGSTFTHCRFNNATWGLHSHFTNLSITDSYFTRNYGGIRFRSGPVEISRSRFSENTIGIRSFRGNANISRNEITGNETGIFVREKGSGLSICDNNIFSNAGYNIRVGDFNDEDVSAPNNWWGVADPVTTIFDGRQEPGIGMVQFEPPLTKPLEFRGGVRQ